MRQRLWGAAVLIALAVIFLPLLLDGAGSESRFRRVERLREEPPRIVGERDATSVARAPGTTDVAADRPDGRAGAESDIGVGEDDPPDIFREPPLSAARAIDERARREAGEAPRAWVIQAGSFREEDNAIAVRDRLRRAGYATFVSDASDATAPLFRVQVGPIVDEGRAERTREELTTLLGGEAIVVGWP